MSWTKGEFREFCKKAGISPEMALETGEASIGCPDPRKKSKHSLRKSSTNKLAREKQCSNEVNHNHPPTPNPIPQPDPSMALGKKKGALEQDRDNAIGRIRVYVIGYRVRPLDKDNFIGGCKDVIDAIKHAWLIEDDDWLTVQPIYTQEKVKSFQAEKTVIRIEHED